MSEETIYDALIETSDQVSDQVKNLILVIGTNQKSSAEIMQILGLKHNPTFRKNYLIPALAMQIIEYTQANSPKSPSQKYILTPKGLALLQGLKSKDK